MMVTKQLEDKPIRALWFLFQTCYTCSSQKMNTFYAEFYIL